MNTEITPAPVIAAARVLAKRHAEACGTIAADVWTFYSEDFIADATAALQAAGYRAASGAPQEAPGDAPRNGVLVPSDKLAELQKEAARYRWLREYAPSLLAEIWNDDSYISRPEDVKLGEAKLWLDHLIDAAMKGPQ